MRRADRQRVLCFVLGLAGLFAGAAACAHRVQSPALPAPLPPAVAATNGKQVLAFYYGWYGNPQQSGSWVHWSGVDAANRRIEASTHYPTLGAYDSHDPALVEQQMRWARDAGITGFIVSWWRQHDFHDDGMPLLLDTARRFGLRITVYFEDVKPRGAPTLEGAIDDVMYLVGRYGSHPAWLKVDGKPVMFVYSRAVGQLKLDGWQTVSASVAERSPGGVFFVGDQMSAAAAQVFDAIHTYNPTGSTAGKSIDELRAWAQSTFPKWIDLGRTARVTTLTILAGYDDSKIGRKPPRPITDRHAGETFRVLWEEAISANPDWVLICSWNEWHEGSEIEPSDEHGDRELRTAAEYARKFLAIPRGRERAASVLQ